MATVIERLIRNFIEEEGLGEIFTERQPPVVVGEVVKDEALGAGWGDLVSDRLTIKGPYVVRAITDKFEARGLAVRTRDHAKGDADYWRGGANHNLRVVYNKGPRSFQRRITQGSVIPENRLVYGAPHNVTIGMIHFDKVVDALANNGATPSAPEALFNLPTSR